MSLLFTLNRFHTFSDEKTSDLQMLSGGIERPVISNGLNTTLLILLCDSCNTGTTKLHKS